MNKKGKINSDLNKIRVLQIGMGYNLGGTEVLIKNLNDNLEDDIVFDFLASNQSKIAYEDEYKKMVVKFIRYYPQNSLQKKYYPK